VGSGEDPECTLPVPTPSFTYVFQTADVMGYCLPLTNVFAAPSVALCVSPNCTDVGLNVSCADIQSRPDETGPWEICPDGTSQADCDSRAAYCNYTVEMETAQTFLPATTELSSASYTVRLAAYIQSVAAAWESLLEAASTIWLAGVLFPILLGILWLIFLFLFAGLIIYTLLTLLIVGLLVLDVFFCIKAGAVPDSVLTVASETADAAASYTNSSYADSLVDTTFDVAEGNEVYYYYVAAFVSIGLTLAMGLFLCCNCTAIRRSIAVVEESTKVFRSLPILTVWPLISMAFQIGLVALGMFGLYFIVYPTVWDDYSISVVLALLTLLGILWSLEFVQACTYTSIAAAVAQWFVSQGDDKGWCEVIASIALGCGCGQMIDASWTVIAKHMGSMAFGSLIIAICQFIRAILHAFDAYTKEQQKENCMLKVAMKCAQYAMWCLQKSIEFVSYYAYVHIATTGVGFCSACGETFSLLAKYPAQVAINGQVKWLLQVMISASIPILCTVYAYASLEYNADYTADYSAIWPTLSVFVISLLIAQGITVSLTCCIDTIYVCAFQDMQTGNPQFMSDDLKEAFGIDAAEEEAGTSARKFIPVSQRKNAPGTSTEGAGSARDSGAAYSSHL